MKKLYFLILALCFFNLGNAQIIDIPDSNLKMKLMTLNVDTNSNFQIEVSEALSLNFLDISNQNISSLQGLQYFTNLQYLNCSNNPINNSINFNLLTKLDYLNYSNIQSVTYFNLDNSNIKTLILDGLSNLNYLQCNDNKNLTQLSINGAINLKTLWCANNKVESLNLSGLINLEAATCNNNQLITLDASNLLKLKTLDCAGNLLTSLKVNGSTSLTSISCHYNKLLQLDLSGLTNLGYLLCHSNQLMNLNVNGSTNLIELYCDGNAISSLNLNGLQKLEYVNCSSNQLQYLNVNGLPKLKGFRCINNKLTALDLTQLESLTKLECSYNQLKMLDVSDLGKLEELNCSNNGLNFLYIRNGSNEVKNLNFSENPNLVYVCADESQLSQVQSLLNNYGYTNCSVNAYCSFNPVGQYFIVSGDNKIDADNNGCDTQDLSLPNLKLNISNGTDTSSYIANGNNYSIALPTGTHSITPVLENPTYFSITPSVVNVDFPSQTSPLNQNFCITPNGIHSDLEIAVLPINPARPGFNATYKLIYTNKGNVVQSGTVNLTFDDSVLDVISANPATSSQATNNLLWNFGSLKPYESKEMLLTVKVNSPTSTPAVNNGDILKFTAVISSQDNDETPLDNTFALNQTVVGSYDPNDKTCLEGSVITSKLIGEYVHYMIRFENTGTYMAQNIVVKDMIDLSKFDISSLITTSSSHPFITKISEGNKVEFIFEGINLPFDDASNDGYVAFKIKTKPTLVVGDTFTNDANIYFDYNFPILTNKATSTFKTTLSTEDFNFSKYLSLYPNPANQFLNISQNQNIEVQSFEIYDILGQLVIAIPNAKSTTNIDISKLKSGNYFIKVKSDKGSSSIKFIKI
ncbi:T9SS type A sorting domain-containing protein [Flavobacterium branchiicola]|uniref:T9SS type A sorting domain-containing protein n=2 Tax=Flavobacterium branchiicola TaxID=1114875 RepID=A0ABV9PCM8_9FLAO|nr:T9SS type A sorting domain-containing protein [Flavobacterium branchiicola]